MLQPLNDLALTAVVNHITAFEGNTEAGAAAGANRNGARFEETLALLWPVFADALRNSGADRHFGRIQGSRKQYDGFVCLFHEDRKLYMKSDNWPNDTPIFQRTHAPWLEHRFQIARGIATRIGQVRLRSYAPSEGPFAGDGYSSMFQDRFTEFDGSLLLMTGNYVFDKVLVEAKSAKPNQYGSIAGNVHERAVYQMLEFTELASEWPQHRRTLWVPTSSTFDRYPSKYHLTLNYFAEHLSDPAAGRRIFITSSAIQYMSYLRALHRWLSDGTDPTAPI